ncbi:Tex family protein [Methanobrevibacter curvatus]|uniref:30S ribosomal protein S1 n=1 Tax=Methanobrevibacter curvatus TaxID=49547 RepID=A0A165Z9B5_9EURY|nr:Tex family protein [Methanobrevibacter curvatus]KZX10422.1 30S ribosomal protein S1 [Methanobrevibacter curvatus]
MIGKAIAKELNIKDWQSEAAIKLIDEGNTIPFISRYRKEATGSLSDEILRKFEKKLIYLRNLEEKKEQVLKSIENQGKLTEKITESIKKAKTLIELEDIYRPFKPKKRTKATIAKEKGLEELANIILEQKIKIPIEKVAEKFISPEKEVFTIEEAINGAQNIIAEIVSDNGEFRQGIRKITYQLGNIEIKAKNKDLVSKYEMYYDYSEKISSIAHHRVLAINRGDKEDFLNVKIAAPIEKIINYLNVNTLINHQRNKNTKIPIYNEFTRETIEKAILDSYKRLIAPAVEREIRNFLFEKAEEKSILVFSKNLEQILMEGPIREKTVLGWDPGFKNGCKLAVVNKFGEVLDTDVIYPNEPQNKITEAKKIVSKLIKEYNVDLISLGNGTASRESEEIIAEIIKGKELEYVIVSESGASIYSASELGSSEFPNMSVETRSAVSIARRLQDPLSELVKIDPKSIGVGQYQHDMNQKLLDESLKSVVEKTVNNVGVDLNTASISLLKFVSGISEKLAKNIVDYRKENGIYTSRKELLNVKKLGKKTYQQCAGFLKVHGSDNFLDLTTVHPESYEKTKKLINILGYNIDDFKATEEDLKKINFNKLKLLKDKEFKELSEKLAIGEPTLKDIVAELKKPGRDPREDMSGPILRKDALTIEDLEEGMILEGTVRNIVDFGAFVDIGVHQEGLVHISKMVENKFVKHPLNIVSVGEIVKVKVLEVDISRNRIQLTMVI